MKKIIIAGSTKCGTTSLFNYLVDHPDVAKPFTKETRYFLDSTYPLPKSKKYRYSEGEYDALFFNSGEQFSCEATPDYMYSKGTPERIKRYLGEEAFIIFLLRKPEERFLSWHNHAIQTGAISKDQSLEQFIKIQKISKDYDFFPEQYMNSFVQGDYGFYLKPWEKLFKKSHMFLIDTDDLKNFPDKVMKSLCVNLDLDSSFYRGYRFVESNVSENPRSMLLSKMYYWITRNTRLVLPKSQFVVRVLRPVRVFVHKRLFSEKGTERCVDELALIRKKYQEIGVD